MTPEEAWNAAGPERYWRNGTTIHGGTCRWINSKGTTYWKWAEGIDRVEVEEKIGALALMYKFCKKCFPLSEAEEIEKLRELLKAEQEGES